MGLLSPYGLMWNLAVVVFICCSCFVWSLVFERIQIRVFDGAMVIVGRGRHSGFLFSGVTKPLRAYMEPSRVCLYGLFWFVMYFVFIKFQFFLGACFLSII